jgi:hypothetical protein
MKPMLKLAATALLLSAFALPAFSGSHKTDYPKAACADVWAAVKLTLGNAENYEIKLSDESKMTANYAVHHSAHVTLTGTLRQRPNTVTLKPQGSGSQMVVDSNYSGFEHNDAGDFAKRVTEAMAKGKDATPAEAAKPAK